MSESPSNPDNLGHWVLDYDIEMGEFAPKRCFCDEYRPPYQSYWDVWARCCKLNKLEREDVGKS